MDVSIFRDDANLQKFHRFFTIALHPQPIPLYLAEHLPEINLVL